MLPYSGTFAKLGKFNDDGFRLHVEQQGGPLGGRRIEFVQVDDELCARLHRLARHKSTPASRITLSNSHHA
jgi:ABC-type branched-subunit amino acid transport system substrate-binding protein